MSDKLLIYNKLLERPLIPNKSYPLNLDNIQKYLAEIREDVRPIIKKIFEKTKHVSYKTFKFILNANFKEFIHYCSINNIKNVYLFFRSYDDESEIPDIFKKSNFWIAQHFIQYIKKYKIDLNVLIIYNKEDSYFIKTNEIILVLDDCAYTGQQLSYELQNCINDIKDRKLNLYILITFISEQAIKRIKDDIRTHNVIFSKNINIIYPMSKYLTKDELKIITKYKIGPKFDGIDVYTNYPIYFDHKLADSLSTFTSIYSGFIPIKNQVIPVITNCEHITEFKPKDEVKPKCPPNPYKIKTDDGYDKTLFKKYSSKLNDNRKLKINSLLIDKKKVKKPTFYSDRRIKSKTSSPKKLLISPNKQKSFIMKNKINSLKDPPLIPIQSYPIIKSKLTDFLQKYRNDIKKSEDSVFEKIIDNIYYFSYDTFKTALFTCFDNLIKYYNKNKLTKITFIINLAKKYTSRYWVAQHFMQYLNEKSIVNINIDFINDFKSIKDNTKETYVYFDDCLYNVERYDEDKLNKNIEALKTDNTFLIVCPYFTEYIYSVLNKYNKNTIIFHSIVLSEVNSFLNESDIKILKSSVMRKILDSTLVYFDHSIDRMNTYYTELDDLHSFIECFVKNDYIPSPYTVFNIERHIHLFKKYPVVVKEKPKTPPKKEVVVVKEKTKTPPKKEVVVVKGIKSKYFKRDLTAEDCKAWKKNKIANPLKPKNPITNYAINTDSPIYKELDKHCSSMKLSPSDKTDIVVIKEKSKISPKKGDVVVKGIKSKYFKRDLTAEDCKAWKKNKIDNPLKPKNPITNYAINTDSPIYKELDKHCASMKLS